jgi:hypothetical protein
VPSDRASAEVVTVLPQSGTHRFPQQLFVQTEPSEQLAVLLHVGNASQSRSKLTQRFFFSVVK